MNMESENIEYADERIPEILEDLGFYEHSKTPGLWSYAITEDAIAYVDFRKSPRGRRYAKRGDEWVNGDDVPILQKFKELRDRLTGGHREEKNLERSNTTSVVEKSPQSQPERQREAEQELTIETIKRYINPRVTGQEASVFLRICKARGLNPFAGEVHLIKYKDGEPASIVVGKDAFTKRAEEHPAFDGFEAGIVVRHKGEIVREIEHREGSTLYSDEEELIGGWARVHRKDRSMPFYNEVTLSEYTQYKKNGEVQRFWREKPATMIRKVALVQSLREAFPSDLGGLYDQSEMGVEQE